MFRSLENVIYRGTLLVCLALGARPCAAHIFHMQGIGSDFLVLSNRVYFVQADDTVTTLDLPTGHVLNRGTTDVAGSTLEMCSVGLLAVNGQTVKLFDPDTLAFKAQVADHVTCTNPEHHHPQTITNDPAIATLLTARKAAGCENAPLLGWPSLYLKNHSYTGQLSRETVMLERLMIHSNLNVSVITVQYASNRWCGILDYLHPFATDVIPRYHSLAAWDRSIVTIARADECLLLGSDMGTVECLDLATGRSRWLYAFPAYCGQLSSSGPEYVPYLAALARRFYRDEHYKQTIAGTCLVDEQLLTNAPALKQWLADPARHRRPPLTYDPAPHDWYAMTATLMTRIWTLVLSQWLAIVLALVTPMRRFVLRHIWSLGLLLLAGATVALGCSYYYSRVSFATALALQLTWWLFALGVLVVVGVLVRRRALLVPFLFLLGLATAVCAFWPTVHYAIAEWLGVRW